MKRKLAVFGIAVALFLGAATEERARANTSVGFNLFYSSLAPYGNWVPYQDYGYAWSPTQVGAGWQPYIDGQWVWSTQGWTWASYEPWGWATYHYGRWVFDPYYGWLWVPGTTWAPAWVSWYQSPGYVGWSPLPPDNNFFLEIGFSFVNYDYGYYGYDYGYYGYGHGHKHGKKHRHHKKGHYYDNDYYAPWEHSVFVPEDKFVHNNAKLVALDAREKDLTVLRNVRNITNIKVDNDKVFNYGPDKGTIERVNKGKIKQVSLVDSDLTAVRKGNAGRNLSGNVHSVYRPKIERKEGETPFSGRNSEKASVKSPTGIRGNTDDGRTGPQGLAPKTGDWNTLVQDRGKSAYPSGPYGSQKPGDYGVIGKDDNGIRNRISAESSVSSVNNANPGRPSSRLGEPAAGPDLSTTRQSPVGKNNLDRGAVTAPRNNPGRQVDRNVNQGMDRSRPSAAIEMPRAPQERPQTRRPSGNNLKAPEMRQPPSPARGNINTPARPRQNQMQQQQNRVRSVNTNRQPSADYRPQRTNRSSNSVNTSRPRSSYNNRGTNTNRSAESRSSSYRSSPGMRSNSSRGAVKSVGSRSSVRGAGRR